MHQDLEQPSRLGLTVEVSGVFDEGSGGCAF